MPRAETTNGLRNRRGRRAWLTIALGFFLSIGVAWASGPRWVTGPPYFTGPSGNAVVWYTTQPLYFTDPDDLSASVNHAAADALVAAAAARRRRPMQPTAASSTCAGSRPGWSGRLSTA